MSAADLLPRSAAGMVTNLPGLPADAIDAAAGAVTASHLKHGGSLLGTGVVVLDDADVLPSDGGARASRRCAGRARAIRRWRYARDG